MGFLRSTGRRGRLAQGLAVAGALALVGVGVAGPAAAATPAITVAPTIDGTTTVGKTLTAKPGGLPAKCALVYAYQWLRAGVTINGATDKKYTLAAADAGKTVSVQVTATKGPDAAADCSGPATKASDPTAAVAKGTLTGVEPTITGNPFVGQTLTASAPKITAATDDEDADEVTEGWGPVGVVLSYVWKRGDVEVSKEPTYVLVDADLGKTLTVTVTGTLAGYESKSKSAESDKILAASTTPTTPTATTTRLAGADRYATAVAISKSLYGPKLPMPQTVYVASGSVFPDALSTASVAGLDHGPLLLVSATSVPTIVAEEIGRLKPQRIVVVGGPGAVSDATFAQLKTLANNAVRIGGKDRYETSRLVAEYGMNVAKVFTAGATANAFIATGTDFPDALSAGAVAGLPGVKAPVILEPGTASAISAQATALLTALGTTKAAVVGGTGVVSPAFLTSIPAKFAPVRVAGNDRYLTSQAIVNTFRVPLTVTGPENTQSVFATGLDFPDALAGAAYAGASGSTLWVIPPSCVPAAVLTTATSLKLNHSALLGGPGALQSSVDSLTACK